MSESGIAHHERLGIGAGATFEQVEDAESAPPHHDESGLFWFDHLVVSGGDTVVVSYTYLPYGERLRGVAYLPLSRTPLTEAGAGEAYDRLRAALVSRYGEPAEEEGAGAVTETGAWRTQRLARAAWCGGGHAVVLEREASSGRLAPSVWRHDWRLHYVYDLGLTDAEGTPVPRVPLPCR